MSKEAATRAMREAKYAAMAAKPKSATSAARPPVAPAVGKAAAKKDAAKKAATEPAASVDGACGHRSMNGRTCTREAGHAAKSHRYS